MPEQFGTVQVAVTVDAVDATILLDCFERLTDALQQHHHAYTPEERLAVERAYEVCERRMCVETR